MTNTETKTADLRLEFIPRDGSAAIPMEYPDAAWVTLERLTEVGKAYAERREFTAVHVQQRPGSFSYGWITRRIITMTITVTEV